MKTVNDYINANYPDLELIIEGRNPDNKCDSYAPIYYRGSIANIPVRFRSCEVLDQAYSLGYDLPVLQIPFKDNYHLI